jgi:hypothetical protein
MPGAPAGSAEVAGVRRVRVPVVIRAGKMCPLDVMVTEDSRVVPLTENRLRAAIFRPQSFDITSVTPGDQSMIGQLYPPYRQNYGAAGGAVMPVDMGKYSSALEEYLDKDATLRERVSQVLEKKAASAVVKASGPVKRKLFTKARMKLLGIPVAGAAGAAGGVTAKREMRKRGSAFDDEGTVAKGMMPGTEGYHSEQMREALKDKSSGPDIANAKKASVLEAILPTINTSDLASFKDSLQDPNIRLAYEKNASAVLPSMQMLLEWEPMKKLSAMIPSMLTPSVTQLVRAGDGYKVKTASHTCWQPEEAYIDRGTAIQSLGSEVVLAADLSGSATLAKEAQAEAAPTDVDTQTGGPVSDPGLYKVNTEDGQELIGYVIPDLVDVDGSAVPLSLFTNGSQAAVQGDIVGTPVATAEGGIPTGDAPTGYGAFFTQVGQLQATIPMTITASMAGIAEGEPMVFEAETFDGRPVQVSLQPNIQGVTGTPEGRMLIPANWLWTPLAQADNVALVSAEESSKQAQAQRTFASVEVVSGGETFSVRGPAVEKLASDQRDFLDINDAMFLLAGLGVDQSYGMQKLGEASSASAPVQVKVGRFIKTAEQRVSDAKKTAAAAMNLMPYLRQSLIKEAAAVTDPEAVDVVLALGFINPENISTFIGYLPELDSAQRKLCELLVAARLGLTETSEDAIQKAVVATEHVLEGLKTLAFQGPTDYN